jgi:hypothetical protein
MNHPSRTEWGHSTSERSRGQPLVHDDTTVIRG